MEALREYLLRITAAAIICGIAVSLLGQKGTAASLCKFLAGIFLVLTVLSPLVELSIGDWKDYWENFSLEGVDTAEAGKAMAVSAQSDIIKQNLEAYILDKAASLGAELTVEVTLEKGDILSPRSVELSGQVSPYARQQLSEMIERDLGITKEAQEWTGQP